MDLKQLKALVTVAEVGSVTRAAEVLHLVQPAVTRQIKALEQELGVALFERTPQGMVLTTAGSVMAARAGRALLELGHARAEIAPTPAVLTGVVTVGMLESLATVLAGPLVTAVLAHHPHIELRMLIGKSGDLQQWLDEGGLDLCLLSTTAAQDRQSADASPGAPASLSNTMMPLVIERLWAVGPPSAGLCAGQPVPLAKIAIGPLVLAPPGDALRLLLEGAATRAHLGLDIAMQTNSLAVQKQLVRHGHGLAILPGAAIANELARGTLSAAPLCEPEIRRRIALGLPYRGHMTSAAESVARELGRRVSHAVHHGHWPSAELCE